MHAFDWLSKRGRILRGAIQAIEGVHFYGLVFVLLMGARVTGQLFCTSQEPIAEKTRKEGGIQSRVLELEGKERYHYANPKATLLE